MTADPLLRSRLKARARSIASIRQFFAERDVVEVETPALSAAATTDPALISLRTQVAALDGTRYLHTSPEHAMKRLLAAGSGDIFQIARVFRDGELGRWHQPEFVLLEWYRTGFDELRLMDEVYQLLLRLLTPVWQDLPRLDISYCEAFQNAVGIDPLDPSAGQTGAIAEQLAARELDIPDGLDRDGLLDLALSAVVVPDWPKNTAVFLYDYPPGQAALAELNPGPRPVAARFEVFVNGVELGNGFRELTDATEQRRRFEAELAVRQERGLDRPPIDTMLLAALEHGLPACAGVAVGVDRLLALVADKHSVAEVVCFPHT